MKEYKLIKKYPSLPKDWEEGMMVGVDNRYPNVVYSPSDSKYSSYLLDKFEVEEHPEFWDGTSVYSIGTRVIDCHIDSSRAIYEKVDDDAWQKVFPKTISSTFSIDESLIGKTPGDKVRYVITKHANEALFITDDDYSVFKGDLVYCVSYSAERKEYTRTQKIVGSFDENQFKCFFHADSANKFALRKTPCLSLEDIENFYDGTYRHIEVDREKLLELVTSKTGIE